MTLDWDPKTMSWNSLFFFRSWWFQFYCSLECWLTAKASRWCPVASVVNEVLGVCGHRVWAQSFHSLQGDSPRVPPGLLWESMFIINTNHTDSRAASSCLLCAPHDNGASNLTPPQASWYYTSSILYFNLLHLGSSSELWGVRWRGWSLSWDRQQSHGKQLGRGGQEGGSLANAGPAQVTADSWWWQ